MARWAGTTLQANLKTRCWDCARTIFVLFVIIGCLCLFGCPQWRLPNGESPCPYSIPCGNAEQPPLICVWSSMTDGAIKTSQPADVSLSDTTNIPNPLFLAAWILAKQFRSPGAELPPSVNYPCVWMVLPAKSRKTLTCGIHSVVEQLQLPQLNTKGKMLPSQCSITPRRLGRPVWCMCWNTWWLLDFWPSCSSNYFANFGSAPETCSFTCLDIVGQYANFYSDIYILIYIYSDIYISRSEEGVFSNSSQLEAVYWHSFLQKNTRPRECIGNYTQIAG